MYVSVLRPHVIFLYCLCSIRHFHIFEKLSYSYSGLVRFGVLYKPMISKILQILIQEEVDSRNKCRQNGVSI